MKRVPFILPAALLSTSLLLPSAFASVGINSASDRQWIQTLIDNAKHSSGQPEPPPLQLSDVVFRWDVPGVFRKGVKSLISVSAEQGAEGVPRPVTCTMNGTSVSVSRDKAVLEWTPDKQVTVVVNCESDGLHDMRIFEREDAKI